MRRIVLASLLLALGSVPAFAYDTPKALLTALYAPYFKGESFDWNKWDDGVFRSKALNVLFARDTKEAEGGVGRIDFDPYIDGQDYVITVLKIGEPKINGTTATDEVTFKNMGLPEDLTFTLVDEAGAWKIDDVVSHSRDNPYSLKKIMSGPLD
jgi:Protein of unknown function (DUF3828)